MLDKEQLKREAMAETGLSAFGDAPMDEGLSQLCDDLNRNLPGDSPQLGVAAGLIRNTLMERLKVEDTLARHPEILDEKIERPLFVISLPRTGSTATSQFLSEDPAARSIRRWECNNVTPPPDAALGDHDPRIVKMEAEFEAMYKAQPERRGMLPVDARDPSEHGPLLGLTFQNLQLPSLFAIPAYTRWAIDSDLRPAYAYMRKVLQLLQWKTPAPHWNLKNPPDIFGMDALLDQFPDARLLWIHRDPVKSIPSVCSLTGTIRRGWGEDVDKKALGRMQLAFQSEGARLAMAMDARLPKARIVHAFQRDLVRDTVGTIAQAYDALGLPFTDSYREHLTRRVETRDKPSHAYTLEEFGLTRDAIRDAFKDYTDHYGIPLEG